MLCPPDQKKAVVCTCTCLCPLLAEWCPCERLLRSDWINPSIYSLSDAALLFIHVAAFNGLVLMFPLPLPKNMGRRVNDFFLSNICTPRRMPTPRALFSRKGVDTTASLSWKYMCVHSLCTQWWWFISVCSDGSEQEKKKSVIVYSSRYLNFVERGGTLPLSSRKAWV